MPRADFHEVRGTNWEAALCRQVLAAWEAGERVYVWAESEAGARRLDELLWTFAEDAFLPHDLWQGELQLATPVAVGWRPGNPNGATCAVLATDASPADLDGFARVVDFAPVDVPERIGPARDRYRALREAGFQVSFHPAR